SAWGVRPLWALRARATPEPARTRRTTSPRRAKSPRAPRGASISWSTFKHILGDDESLNFARALVDLGDARIAVVALDAELGRVAVAAVDLDGFVCDAR